MKYTGTTERVDIPKAQQCDPHGIEQRVWPHTDSSRCLKMAPADTNNARSQGPALHRLRRGTVLQAVPAYSYSHISMLEGNVPTSVVRDVRKKKGLLSGLAHPFLIRCI